jgi:hypothetical protein
MTALNSRLSLVVVALAGMIVVSTPLSAAQKGPSRTKMPPLSAEQAASSKDKAGQPPSKENRRTPFGETKSVAKAADKVAPPATSPFIEVEEKGDTIIFQRRTPFGRQTWSKKRSELTPQEEEMMRAHKAGPSADATGSAADAVKAKTEPASPEAATSGESRTTAGQDREKR